MRLTALAVCLGSLTLASAVFAQEAELEQVAPVDPERDAASPRNVHLVVRASGGGAGRALFDSFVGGAEADVGVGVDSRAGSFGLALAFFGGVVEGGFTVVHGTMGFDLEWPVGDFRFGFRPRVGYIDVDRMTTERQFGAYSLGIAGRASYDVSRSGGLAVALGVQPTVDVIAALGNDGASADSAAPLVGARAFVELRWRRAD